MARLKSLTIDDIPQCLKLSQAENWNQTEKDWKFLIETPGNICLALENQGSVVATATAFNYENRVAWIGMVLVTENQRGKGYSKLLVSEILHRLKTVPTIKLDATSAGLPVYLKLDFRIERIVNRLILEPNTGQFPDWKNGRIPATVHPANVQDICKYESEVFGSDRNTLLEYLILERPENAFRLTHNGQVNGFAAGRLGARYFQISPVSAESEQVARILMTQMLKTSGHQPVVADVPDDKNEFQTWLTAVGFKMQRQFTRMVSGEKSADLPRKQFLTCGPEFG